MPLPQKFGNCPFICIFSWRERLVWLGYGCINTQGKNRISYSCRTIYDNSSEATCLMLPSLLVWENVARVYNIEE
jgi:hypothetical protein